MRRARRPQSPNRLQGPCTTAVPAPYGASEVHSYLQEADEATQGTLACAHIGMSVEQPSHHNEPSVVVSEITNPFEEDASNRPPPLHGAPSAYQLALAQCEREIHTSSGPTPQEKMEAARHVKLQLRKAMMSQYTFRRCSSARSPNGRLQQTDVIVTVAREGRKQRYPDEKRTQECPGEEASTNNRIVSSAPRSGSVPLQSNPVRRELERSRTALANRACIRSIERHLPPRQADSAPNRVTGSLVGGSAGPGVSQRAAAMPVSARSSSTESKDEKQRQPEETRQEPASSQRLATTTATQKLSTRTPSPTVVDSLRQTISVSPTLAPAIDRKSPVEYRPMLSLSDQFRDLSTSRLHMQEPDNTPYDSLRSAISETASMLASQRNAALQLRQRLQLITTSTSVPCSSVDDVWSAPDLPPPRPLHSSDWFSASASVFESARPAKRQSLRQSRDTGGTSPDMMTLRPLRSPRPCFNADEIFAQSAWKAEQVANTAPRCSAMQFVTSSTAIIEHVAEHYVPSFVVDEHRTRRLVARCFFYWRRRMHESNADALYAQHTLRRTFEKLKRYCLDHNPMIRQADQYFLRGVVRRMRSIVTDRCFARSLLSIWRQRMTHSYLQLWRRKTVEKRLVVEFEGIRSQSRRRCVLQPLMELWRLQAQASCFRNRSILVFAWRSWRGKASRRCGAAVADASAEWERQIAQGKKTRLVSDGWLRDPAIACSRSSQNSSVCRVHNDDSFEFFDGRPLLLAHEMASASLRALNLRYLRKWLMWRHRQTYLNQLLGLGTERYRKRLTSTAWHRWTDALNSSRSARRLSRLQNLSSSLLQPTQDPIEREAIVTTLPQWTRPSALCSLHPFAPPATHVDHNASQGPAISHDNGAPLFVEISF